MRLTEVNEAYSREGLKYVLKEGYRAGVRTLLPMGLLQVDGAAVLSSEDLSGKEDASIWDLPELDYPTHFSETDSTCLFEELGKTDEFIQDHQYSYRNDFVSELDNVRLLGPDGVGITGEGCVIEDSVTMPGHNRVRRSIQNAFVHHPVLTFQTLNGPRHLSFRSTTTLDIACSLYSSWDNYYHWFMEHLPKLRGIEYYERTTGNKLAYIIPRNPPSFILESLRLLGVDLSNCVEWQPPTMNIKTLVLPAYPEPTPSNLHWIRTKFQEAAQDTQSGRLPDRVYISRDRARNRRVKNESEVIDLLDRNGFTRVFAEELPVSNQVTLFSNASVIVGPHGAGLTNMIWANQANIIEIHNNKIRDHYSVLANNLGHTYTPLKGESVNPDQLNSDMIVDTKKIHTALSTIGLV